MPGCALLEDEADMLLAVVETLKGKTFIGSRFQTRNESSSAQGCFLAVVACTLTMPHRDHRNRG